MGFSAFIEPSDQNQLYHTSLLSKIWVLTENKKIVNDPFKCIMNSFLLKLSKQKRLFEEVSLISVSNNFYSFKTRLLSWTGLFPLHCILKRIISFVIVSWKGLFSLYLVQDFLSFAISHVLCKSQSTKNSFTTWERSLSSALNENNPTVRNWKHFL